MFICKYNQIFSIHLLLYLISYSENTKLESLKNVSKKSAELSSNPVDINTNINTEVSFDVYLRY